jgi:beta-glucosidase
MPADSSRAFPSDFVWGSASASYQVEGAADEDARGESIWDRFAATPGKVRNGEDGAIACDFYHRYPDDIGLMRDLGLDAFRFSIAWPRILPEGRGSVNNRGLDFYDRLVDALLDAGIRPFATLYHWDLPQTLEDAGGWPARETVDAFGEYVQAVVSRLGDRPVQWITLNEPWVSAWVGYGWGHHAPGRTSERDALAAAHHLMLAHGRAIEILRAGAPSAKLGITLNLGHVYPESDDDADAARHVDGFNNRWFLDPIFRGEYPEDMLDHFADSLPDVHDGDLAEIATPLDFLGVNNYSRNLIRADRNGGGPIHVRDPHSQYTDMGWEVYPDGLQDLLVRLRDDYAPPAIYITENGAAFPDVRGHDGHVHDPERLAYIEGHIDAVGRAVEAGVPVRGYFVWTLLDNYEWAWGYWKRFGIVYVDFPTQERVPKDSFHWYRDFIAAQRAAPAGELASAAES